MTHELPELEYEYDALEPFFDKETMEIHHTKHHQTYVDKLNAALEGHEDLQTKDVDELIKDLNSVPEEIRTAVRNHGGGHSNHSFFWKLLKKDTSAKDKEIQKALHEMFQSGEAFEEAFSEAALKIFGSGWAWVVLSDGKLEIITTPNQDSPLNEGKIPIIGLDMWEHSFYKLRGPDKAAYLEAFFDVLNWDQAEENFMKAKE
ncbi:MAG: superoxide dismutase [Nanoarchaeota archaeon]|nr:superoxide dismutase [Nanoarchaeota archaeon]